MDPIAVFNSWKSNGNDKVAAKTYNAWIAKDGFPARVQLHPATDLWMRGARYGEVVKLGTKYAHIKLDATGKIVHISPDNLIEI